MQLKISIVGLVGLGISTVAHAATPLTPVRRCAPDAVLAGTVCMDTYEATVWRLPDAKSTNANLVRKIQLGTASRADLATGGATQLGTEHDDYAGCTDNGQSCANDIFAVSLPDEIPARFLTWFQAQEACANSGKRLPTNAEWQVGANGTPDPGPDNRTTDCNSDTGSVTRTGSRSNCVSTRGAYDMVGNVAELVADWVPASTECPGWAGFSEDSMCLAGAGTSNQGPGVLLRGGWFSGGASVGPFAVFGNWRPNRVIDFVGFRCAR